MRICDANVLLYAVNSDAPNHDVARTWLDVALNGDETVGMPWPVLLAFLRLGTHQAVFPRPLSLDAAIDQVRRCSASPSSRSSSPGRVTSRSLQIC